MNFKVLHVLMTEILNMIAGDKCVPICSLKMCKNNGTCIMDLTTERGYRCQCDDRLFLGDYCEKQMELSCPSTWWGWPICGTLISFTTL